MSHSLLGAGFNLRVAGVVQMCRWRQRLRAKAHFGRNLRSERQDGISAGGKVGIVLTLPVLLITLAALAVRLGG